MQINNQSKLNQNHPPKGDNLRKNKHLRQGREGRILAVRGSGLEVMQSLQPPQLYIYRKPFARGQEPMENRDSETVTPEQKTQLDLCKTKKGGGRGCMERAKPTQQRTNKNIGGPCFHVSPNLFIGVLLHSAPVSKE